jgi:hypothetical protein
MPPLGGANTLSAGHAALWRNIDMNISRCRLDNLK